LKIVQTEKDIEYLKINKVTPISLIEIIEQEFLQLLESENSNCLPLHQACMILEQCDDAIKIVGESFGIEYIERLKESNFEYYRIAKRIDQDMQLIYTLVGVHDEKLEKWLDEQVQY
jgi:argonaute-like protein implicated in RNA metabolism and viral defense